MWRFYLLIILCNLFIGCFNQNKEQNGADSTTVELLISEASKKEQHANQFIRQYWNNFNYGDSTMISVLETQNNILVSYIAELSNATLDSARLSIKENLKNAEADPTMQEYFVESYNKFFYDPNSPIRNDELYIPILEHLIASSSINDIEKTRAKSELKLIKKNRVGEAATDFKIVDTEGKELNLYDISTDYTLLIFYNPGCHACAQVIHELQSSIQLEKAIARDEITVFAVYPDPDISIWKNYQSKVPSVWINTYDKNQEIVKKGLYSIRAIPTLYLLDKNKKVILKDTDVKKVERYFSERSINN